MTTYSGGPDMLVLTRKIGESIQINDDVKVTLIDIQGKTVRLGIEAPQDTKIYREEVFLKIKEANLSAADATTFDPAKISQLIKDKLKP